MVEIVGADIGASADGSVWVAGSGKVWRWDGGNHLVPVDRPGLSGNPNAISVTSNGVPWVVTLDPDLFHSKVFRLINNRWERIANTLVNVFDIGAGGQNAVWATSTDNDRILRWDEGANTFRFDDDPAASALFVAVGPNGYPWVANRSSDVFSRDAAGWHYVEGRKAHDIGVGNDGSVWIIGWPFTQGVGGAIWNWRGGNTWDQIDGLGYSITVAPNGLPWVCNMGGAIYRRTG